MSKADKPVEILMAVYDGEAFLAEQIDSILAQSDGRWHLTISDDGSTDGSGAIIDEYVRRNPDRIARYRSGRRFSNARDHFFHLMRRCDTDYMLFCDQDDVWYPDKVLKTGWTIEKAPNVKAPVFKDFPMTLECRVKQKIDESETGYYLIAEIVNILCDEQFLSEDGKPDVARMELITFDPVHHTYIQLGKTVGQAFSDGKKLK